MISQKDLAYFDITKFMADTLSRDNSTKVGCFVIEPESYQILVTGYNGFPRKVFESADRKERPLKYVYTEHAERNAFYHAARHGIKLLGGTLITTMFPCHDCARGIIQVGIKHIITNPQEIERWSESSGYALQMLLEADINISYIGQQDNE